ncbi:unnamed protein product [Prorocentrum cordatum]|uniref:Ribosome biogenesis regulatory protein n=1 Tax=Prorocentrum cordatum TaxID=2364126 RepID=A0ABN9TXN5_9DINO|nr:unnamed protein product [Polarella glacialis]
MTSNDTEECGESDGIDSAVVAVPDAPEVTNLLLRAWARMVQNPGVSQQMALAGAVEEKADRVEAALLPCSTARLQETDKEEKSDDEFLAALAPGEKPAVHKKAKRSEESENAEVTEEQPKPKPKTGHWDPLEKKWIPAEGASRVQELKDMWSKRIEEMREANGYNETAEREAAIARRIENRKHKKHNRTGLPTRKIRYLPQAEVDKVKAKEDAWAEAQRKQMEDDLAHAEERKEDAFKREVEKQMKIMEGKREETTTTTPRTTATWGRSRVAAASARPRRPEWPAEPRSPASSWLPASRWIDYT